MAREATGRGGPSRSGTRRVPPAARNREGLTLPVTAGPAERGGLYFLGAPTTTTSRPRYSETRRGAQPRVAPGRTQSRPQAPRPRPRPGQTPPRGRRRATRRVVATGHPRSRRPSRFGIGQARYRLIALLVALTIVLGVVLGKVAQVQTAGGEDLRAEGVDMWSRTTTLLADRGTIFDRNGEELAVSVPAVSISVNPKLIENPDEVAALLQRALGLTPERTAELRDQMAARQSGFVYVQRQVNPAIGDQLRALRIEGLNVDDEDRRMLPGGDTGRSVIGATDIDGNGVSGLELQFGGGPAAAEHGYTDILDGTPGEASREVAPGGRSIAGTEQVTLAPVPGDDIVLTLDRSIQFATEQALIDKVTEVLAKAGQAIVMDTDTGDILAMASVLRDPVTGVVSVTGRNSAAVDAYEPGSVAKVITMAAALNERGVTPSSTFVVPWRKQYADDLLEDSHQHPDDTMTVQRILVESSNIGTIMVKEATVNGGATEADRVASREVHWNYMRRFGLGERSSLDLPGESRGILKDYDELWGSERATVAYGQGVASTPIQLVAAINAIANDGLYVAPRLVQATVGPDGTITEAAPSATHEVVRPEIAAQVQHMMRAVVCDAKGTGDAAQLGIDNFTVAGKTGTGYKAQPNGTYENAAGEKAYYSSFVGFFPAENPQITVLISIDEPPFDSDARFGSTSAAPVFAALAPVIMHATGIVPPPDPMPCEVFNTLPPGGR